MKWISEANAFVMREETAAAQRSVTLVTSAGKLMIGYQIQSHAEYQQTMGVRSDEQGVSGGVLCTYQSASTERR